MAYCGDGVRDTGEECDDGNQLNNDACSNDCRIPICGDGLIQLGEECDDGRDNSNVNPDRCRLNCQLPSCGDKVLDKGEDCDTGIFCSPECTSTAPYGFMIGATGVGGAFILVFLVRRRLAAIAAKPTAPQKKPPQAIEDVPLSQIERPLD
jgi:cysteine-rich repeat protein